MEIFGTFFFLLLNKTFEKEKKNTFLNFRMPIWSYTTQLPPEYNELLRVSQIGVDAIKAVYGTLSYYLD